MEKSKKLGIVLFSIALFLLIFSTSVHALGPDVEGILKIQERSMRGLLMIGGLGFVLLLIGSEIIGKRAEAIGAKVAAGVGIFLVAMTGSLPELAVAVHSAFAGNTALLVSQIIGSNIVNIALILGLCSVIKPIKVEKGLLKGSMMFAVMVVGALVIFYDVSVLPSISGAVSILGKSQIASQEGILLIGVFLAFLAGMLIVRAGEKMEGGKGSVLLNLGIILLAGVIVWYGAEICVFAFLRIAEIMSISTVIIGATVIAIGTSLPELSLSLLSTIRGKAEIAFGNVAESNVFNIAVIHGIAAFIIPLMVIPEIVIFHIPYMLFTNFVVILIVANNEITRREGIVLLFIYAMYVVLLFAGGPEFFGKMLVPLIG